MDQGFPKVHDLNVAFFRPPELPLGQGRCGFLCVCFYFQLYETLGIRSWLNTAVRIALCPTWGASIAGAFRCSVSYVGGEAAGSIH